MKKDNFIKQFFLFLLVGFVGFIGDVSASGHENYSLSGDGRFRSESNIAKNFLHGDKGTYNTMSTRFRVNFSFNPSDKVSTFFQPILSHTWGNEVSNASTDNPTDNPGLNVHQAFLTWKARDNWNLDAGRFEMSYGDSLLISNTPWNDTGSAFNGLRSRWSIWGGNIDMFFAKIQDNTTTVSSTPAADRTQYDHDLYGLYTSWGLGRYIKEFDVYYFRKNNRSVASAAHDSPVNDKNNLFGLRAKSDISFLDYRAEVTFGKGSTDIEGVAGDNENDFSSRQYDIEAGFALMGDKLRLAGEYFWADKNFEQLYADTHRYLGTADLLARRNVKGFRIGLNGMMHSVKWKLDYHSFERVSTSHDVYKTDGTTAHSLVSSSAKLFQEVDLTLGFKAAKALHVQLGGSYVIPDAAFKDGTVTGEPAKRDRKMVKYYVQLSSSF